MRLNVYLHPGSGVDFDFDFAFDSEYAYIQIFTLDGIGRALADRFDHNFSNCRRNASLH